MPEAIYNGFTTSLTSQMSAVAMSFVVDETSQGPASLPDSGTFRCRIDNEWMLCSSYDNITVTVEERGIEGSTAASHAAATEVEFLLTAGGLTDALNFPTGIIEAASIPNITLNDLTTNNPPVITRWRRVFSAVPENRFIVHEESFEHGPPTYDLLFQGYSMNTNSGTLTTGGHKFRWQSTAVDSSAQYVWLVPGLRIPLNAVEVTVTSHNSIGVASDVGPGFSNVNDNARVWATYRRGSIASGGAQAFLHYEGSGITGASSATVTLSASALNTPVKIGCVLNMVGVAMYVDEGWGQRQVCVLDFGATFPDMRVAATLAKFKPAVFFNTNTVGQDTTISRIAMTAVGPLGYREHHPVRHEDGGPIVHANGQHIITVDSCGPTTLARTMDITAYPSSYDAIHGVTAFFDCETRKITEEIGQLFQISGTKVYAVQQPVIIYVPNKRLFRIFLADWGGRYDHSGSKTSIYYYETSDNVLRGTHFIPDKTTLLNLSDSLPFPAGYGGSHGLVYDPDEIFWNGYYWFSCTEESHGARPWLFKGTKPDMSDAILVGYDATGEGTNTTVGEGARMTIVGGQLYVMTSTAPGAMNWYDSTMTKVKNAQGIDGASAYALPNQISVHHYQHSGKTEYLLIGFQGDDFLDTGGNTNSFAVGRTTVQKLGEAVGYEFPQRRFDL